MAFFHIKPATRKFKPVEDLPQHFTFFDASSESLTLIGVDITRENLHQGLPGVRVYVCLSVCVSVFKIYDEPESQQEYIMMGRNRHMTGVFKKYDEPGSPNEGHV